MRKLLLIIISIVCAMQILYAETIVTKSGKHYRNCKIIRASGAGLVITFPGGGTVIPTDDLPDSLLEEYIDEIESEKKVEKKEKAAEKIKEKKEKRAKAIADAMESNKLNCGSFKIFQALDKGYLIQIRQYGCDNRGDDILFLVNYSLPRNYVDNEIIRCDRPLYIIGRYQYTALRGNLRTVYRVTASEKLAKEYFSQQIGE